MGTISSLVVKIGADIKEFTSGLDRVANSTKSFDKFVSTSFDVGAKAITAMGAAASAVGVNATRMAIDFESSFAGVKKTIDGTDEEFKQISDGLRAMAQQVPVNVNELNRIAESAGALGIAKEGIVDFTKVISQMATTTNLTAEAAANDFARISTIMGIPAEDFSRLGSTIVDLGNKGSTTESEITAMALRLVGAAKTVGMSSAEVAGFAASLSNVGIEAEMGGTAISKLMIDMASNVESGGEKLEVFARVAGMSADQFATAFRSNAASAMGDFIAGLGNIQSSGGSLFATLEELDIKEVRLRDTMLRTASAGDMVSKTLDTARTAWRENSALSEEAGKRYETTASQLQIFQNKLSDTQITLGTALIPLLTKVLEASEPLLGMLKDLANGFAALDPGSQMLIGTLTVVASVFYPAVLALGGFIGAVKNLIPVIKGLWTLMLAHPFVAIATAVGVLAVVIYKNWDEIHEATVRFGQGFNAIITAGLDPVVSGVRKFANEVGGYFSGLYQVVAMNWDKITKVIEGWASTVAAKVDTGLKAVASAFTAANTAITGIARDLAARVEDFLVGRMMAVFNKVKAGIKEVENYFKGLYDAVVGHSYIPDMVEEIGDHMRNLDVTMTAPARNAVVNTGRVIEGGVLTWGATINQFASTANQTWGSVSSTFAQSIARMTDETVNWGEVVKGMGIQLMTNMITLVIGLATQWAIGEMMRTTASVAGDAARVASCTTANAAMLASNTVSATASTSIWGGAATSIGSFFGMIAGGFKALALSLVATVKAVGTFIMGVLSSIASAMKATIFGIPVGVAILAGVVAIGVALAATGNIPGLADGGIVTGPTIAQVGEGRSPETVIPLNERGAKFMQSAMGLKGNQSQVINLNLDKKLLTRVVVMGMPDVIHTKLGYL